MLDESYPRFRVVLYIVNPLAEHRVPVAVVVCTPEGAVASLPVTGLSVGYFGGRDIALAHVEAFSKYLARIADFDTLPDFLGPHFILGRIQSIPTMDWRPWIAGVVPC